MTSSEHTLILTSVDQVGRNLVRPPWAIYPVTPEVAASLIADGMFFAVCMNPDKIISVLADVGVQAAWPQRLDGTEDPSKPLMRVAVPSAHRLRFTALNVAAIVELMYEFIELRTWRRQVAAMLGRTAIVGTWTAVVGTMVAAACWRLVPTSDG